VGDRIVVEPGNPYDFTRDALDALRREIELTDGSLEVVLDVREERGYGVTLHEVIRLVWEGTEDISTAGGAVSAFAIAVKLAKARWWKAKNEHPAQSPRPRSVTLYDARGNPVKAIVIDEPNGEAAQDEAGEPHPIRGLD
jgi:hypothetical protein